MLTRLGIQKDTKKALRIRFNQIIIDKEMRPKKYSILSDELSNIIKTEFTIVMLRHARQSNDEIMESALGTVKVKKNQLKILKTQC